MPVEGDAGWRNHTEAASVGGAAFRLPDGALVGPLDLVAKLHQPRLTRIIQAHKPTGAPVVVELDPTSFCDSACPECVSRLILRTTRFSKSRLLSLVEEFMQVGVQAVILIGGGEPLAHPAIGDVIDRLHDAGIKVGLTTSGTMLDIHMTSVAKAAAWTRVSVDAARPDTYARVRPHRSGRNYFDHVISNIAKLAERKTGKLGYSFMLWAERNSNRGLNIESNFSEIAAAGSLARNLGCDYFEVKPMYNLEHYLLGLTTEQTTEVNASLDQVHRLTDGSFTVISPTTLVEALAKNADQPKAYTECSISDFRTLVTSSGVYLCPYHRANEDAKLGDVQHESFSQIWRSNERLAAVKRIDPSQACRFHCIRHESNLAIEQLRDSPRLDQSESDGTEIDQVFDPFI